MEVRNIKRWAKAGPEPYLVGLAGFCLALGIRYILQPWLDQHLPMLFFAINCIVIAFIYGFWPSFLILLLSLPTALYFFTMPFHSFTIASDSDIRILSVYFSLCTLTAALLEWVRREHYKAFLLARVADSRYRLLVEADEDRRSIAKGNAV